MLLTIGRTAHRDERGEDSGVDRETRAALPAAK